MIQILQCNDSDIIMQWFRYYNAMIQILQYNDSDITIQWFRYYNTMIQILQYNDSDIKIQWFRYYNTMIHILQYNESDITIKWFRYYNTMIMNRKWWPTILPILKSESSPLIFTVHNRITTCGVGNPGPDMIQEHKCGSHPSW
jgi:hypothetical protein